MKSDLDMPKIFPEIEWIENHMYRSFVTEIWQTLWHASEWQDIYDLPVSPKILYPQVVHNRSVVSMALEVAKAYELFHQVKVNRDILLTAGLLQDACFLQEEIPHYCKVFSPGTGGEFLVFLAHERVSHTVTLSIKNQ